MTQRLLRDHTSKEDVPGAPDSRRNAEDEYEDASGCGVRRPYAGSLVSVRAFMIALSA